MIETRFGFATRALSALALALASAANAAAPTPVGAEHGMVVSAHRLASKAGVDVLKSGGNAVDAAVAVAYALAVTFPEAGNLGGGGFMTVRFHDGRTAFIDFRETAPSAATATMYLDANGNPVAERSRRGYLAAGIPGTVAGLELAREAAVPPVAGKLRDLRRDHAPARHRYSAAVDARFGAAAAISAKYSAVSRTTRSRCRSTVIM